jgi:hypothetical protein
MRLDHFFKQEGKTAPHKTPENSLATTPTKTPGYSQGAPFSLGWKGRQSCLCLSNSSTNIHPTPGLNTHTPLLSLVSTDILNLT